MAAKRRSLEHESPGGDISASWLLQLSLIKLVADITEVVDAEFCGITCGA